MSEQLEKAKQVKQEYERNWLAVEDVVGVGIGMTEEEEIAIIISVRANPEQVRKQIPEVVNDIPIIIRLTGEIRAL